MKKRFVMNLEKSLSEARTFFEGSFYEIHNGDQTYFGFPETRGKRRITEWGATSAALAALKMVGINSNETQDKFDIAKEWLASQQSNGGCWEASELYSAEPTAGVLMDFRSMDLLKDISVEEAVSFLKSCHRDDHYTSLPYFQETPHIFTTYIVMKCLRDFSAIEHDNDILEWITSGKALDGKWGQMPKSNIGTVVHTIFALYILHFCGNTWEEIRKDYRDEITWIRRSIARAEYPYEEIEIVQSNTDPYGGRYYRLRLRHFALPLIGKLIMEIGDKANALRVARKMLSQQFTGGWGPSKDELTMWATRQAVEYLLLIKTHILPGINNLKYLYLYVASIPFFIIRTVISILALVVGIILLSLPGYRPSTIASLFVLILAWVLRRN